MRTSKVIRFFIYIYIAVNILILLDRIPADMWNRQINYLKKGRYPKTEKYIYYYWYEKAFEEEKLDRNKWYNVRKKEIFYFIQKEYK